MQVNEKLIVKNGLHVSLTFAARLLGNHGNGVAVEHGGDTAGPRMRSSGGGKGWRAAAASFNSGGISWHGAAAESRRRWAFCGHSNPQFQCHKVIISLSVHLPYGAVQIF
jgi:hypothetical protein